MNEHDSIFSQPMGQIADFAFDDSVARVFPDMLKRSIPGYTTIIANTGLLAGRYASPDSHCYDLGCSLGATTLAMRQQIKAENCRIVAVDNSSAMLERCATVIGSDAHEIDVALRLDDIRTTPIQTASVVALNFTLQFVPLEQRDELIHRIGENMLPGGVLVLSEKVCFEDAHVQELTTDLHHAFKRAHGYSDLEIAQKRTAIENVLIPETLAAHRARITQAGFSSVDVWFQCFNFASIVAIK